MVKRGIHVSATRGRRKEVIESTNPEGEGRVRNLSVKVEKDLFRQSKCMCHLPCRTYLSFPFL